MENTVNLSVQQQAVADIKKWLGLRTKKQLDAVEKFFNGKRNHFTIDKADYEQWSKNNPTQLHAYVAVTKNNKLQFVLIDNVTDEKIAKGEAGDYDAFIRIKAFEKQKAEEEMMLGGTPGNPIPADKALERMDRWDNKQDRDSYLTDELDRTPNEDPNIGIFTVFKIPFGDLEAIFGDEQASSKAYSYMGLKEYQSPCGDAPTDADPAWMADMLLWNDQEHPTAQATPQDDPLVGNPEDTVLICPPVCGSSYESEGYGLIVDAIN